MLNFFAVAPSRAQNRLEAALAKMVDGQTIRNAVLHIHSPRAGIRCTWASGIADERDGTLMEPSTPFVSASVGKLAMAATAFCLADEMLLDLDKPMATWLSQDLLKGLPVKGGDAAASEITVRMLLQNRSGLPDYFDSTIHPSMDGAPDLRRLMQDEPDRRWSRDELLAYAREHFTPYAAPGEKFLYSDLNWDLLSLVFESILNIPFHQAVRKHVLEPLGMRKTWYHGLEEPPEGVGEFADIFAGRTNLARNPSMSLDQAGGGLAGPAEDLGLLVRHLAQGSPVGLDRLGADWTMDAIHRGMDYGYGAWRWRPPRIHVAMRQLPELIGVSSSNNSYAYVSTRGDVIAGTLNQADKPSRHVRFVLSQVLPVLSRLRDTRAIRHSD